MRIAKLTTTTTGATAALLREGPTPLNQSRDMLARTVFESLDDSKAEDIVSIDLKGKTALADAMVIATGRSSTHVGAIADRVIKACKAAGVIAPRVEGLPQCDWVLVDAGDVIVHIFRPEVRQFYNLEKMWSGDRPSEIRRA
jgi:ribosome-associated protein